MKLNSSDFYNKLKYILKQIDNHSLFLTCGFCTSQKSKVCESYKRALKKLNLTEQVVLIWRMCTYYQNYQKIKEK